MTEGSDKSSMKARVGNVRNMGEPLRFASTKPLVGFAAESTQGGPNVKVWVRHAVTSDEPIFHRLAPSLDKVIGHMAQQAGLVAGLRSANMVLLLLRADKTAELWLDTAAVSIRCLAKGKIAAGSAVFDNDIADVTAMCFPCVDIGATDKVLCLFRQDWRFGLAFDFNPGGALDTEQFYSTLGALYRDLRYRNLYEAVGNTALFEKATAVGWFPFAEILTPEFQTLLDPLEAGFMIADAEQKLVAAFDAARLDRILERWRAKPHLASRSIVLKEGLDAFLEKRPVAVLKILLTEIEGALNDAYRAEHGGGGAKLRDLLAFAESSAERRAGGAHTLLFPEAFGHYLRNHVFAKFDPIAQTGTASSRHAVSHGAAAQETYSMVRALQAILTLDQLAFYT